MKNQKASKKIKIKGAGPAGLTAAINLAKEGYQVEVYERLSQVGGKFKENAQMLPNWFSGEDVIEELERCNIKIRPVSKVTKLEIFFGDRKFVTFWGTDRVPIGYTVLRGGENSFEKDLADQAQELGVKIITDFKDEIDTDIIATGVKIEGPEISWAAGFGRVYRGEFDPSSPKAFLGFGPEGLFYNYLYPHSKDRASVVVCGRRTNIADLKNKFPEFKKRLSFDLPESDFLYDFTGFVNFKYSTKTRINKAIAIGEAAGFQDVLFGFGMRYAVLSGFFAAKAISENLNYDALWRKSFLPEFKKIARIKKIFSDLKTEGLNELAASIEKESRINIDSFRKFFLSRKFSFILLIRPFYKRFFKNKHLLRYFLNKL